MSSYFTTEPNGLGHEDDLDFEVVECSCGCGEELPAYKMLYDDERDLNFVDDSHRINYDSSRDSYLEDTVDEYAIYHSRRTVPLHLSGRHA